MNAWNRFRALFLREQLDRELDEEMRSHIDLATEDYIQRGLPPAEARRQALLKFGAIEASKDAHRDSRGIVWLDGLLCDFRFAARALKRESGFAVTTILMLSLAIGLNGTAFRVMDTMLFRGYPLVKHNERLLYLSERFPSGVCCISLYDFEQWRSQAHSFQGMALVAPKRISLSENNGGSREVWTNSISYYAFRLLGVQPAMGRDFGPSDELPGAPRVVIASHRYWKTRLGDRRDVLSQTVRIDGVPASIIGVMPEGFDFAGGSGIWLPLRLGVVPEAHLPYSADAFGRLADGASEAGARAELEAIDLRLASEFPATNHDVHSSVGNYWERQIGPNGPIIYGSLWMGAWFVLWIACANLANLALARVQGRARELSTRMALGAGRVRVIRQLLLESLILAAASGCVAWWVVTWSTQLWAAATEPAYRIHDYSASFASGAYLIAVTLAAAAMVALAPVVQVLRLDVNGSLKSESRSSTLSPRVQRFSALLVAGQMALAIVLMAGAGVLGRSLWTILNADIGVKEPERVLEGRLGLPVDRYPKAEPRVAFFESLQTRLAAMPGIDLAAIGDGRPVDDKEPFPVELEGQTGSTHFTPTFSCSPNYFQTLGATVVAGRDFSSADRAEAPPVTIVNRSFVDSYFPGQNPIGQRIRFFHKQETTPEWRTIVGVVSNIMMNESTRQHFRPVAYLPLEQEPRSEAWFFARTRGVSAGTVSALRARVRELDPTLEILDFSTLKTSLGFDSSRIGDLAKNAVIAPIYAGIALLLASMGLYAMVARSVGRRTKEIGVRMALGAATGEIRRLVLVEGMTPVAAGLGAGLAASIGVNRILQSQLVGVSPYDTLTFTVAPMILLVVALSGCLFPMRQAVRVDPAVALRQD